MAIGYNLQQQKNLKMEQLQMKILAFLTNGKNVKFEIRISISDLQRPRGRESWI